MTLAEISPHHEYEASPERQKQPPVALLRIQGYDIMFIDFEAASAEGHAYIAGQQVFVLHDVPHTDEHEWKERTSAEGEVFEFEGATTDHETGVIDVTLPDGNHGKIVPFVPPDFLNSDGLIPPEDLPEVEQLLHAA